MKRKFTFWLASLIFLASFSAATAQEIADFSLKNVDGNMVSLASFKDKKAVVVIFTSNHCSYSKKYEPKILKLAKNYSANGVQFVLINANDPTLSEQEKFVRMQARAKEKGFTFPYLHDPDKTVAKSFRAEKNPQSYVLTPAGDKFKIQYAGQIDDNALMPTLVKNDYLVNAIEAVLGGASPNPGSTDAVGCAIR